MSSIIVTGGCGFLGKHLVRSLVADGHEVYVIDDLSTGDPEGLPDGVKFRELSVTTALAFRGLKAERVYHLACPASPPKYQADPIATLHTCYMGTLAALEFCKNNDARLLFTSTSEVYGDPTVHPQPESYTGNVHTRGPRCMYDEGKRAAEALCWCYEQKYGTEVRIARIFNTYGPGMNPTDGRVITNFIQQARTGRPMTVYGSGQQTRSFCYVDDTIRGLKLLMESHVQEPINIGNQCEWSIKHLAYEVFSQINPSSLWPVDDAAIEYLPAHRHDPQQRCPDTTRARELLSWKPTTLLRDGLKKMIEEMQ